MGSGSVGKTEITRHRNYVTWMQERVEIGFSENLTGLQSLLKMPYIPVTGRDRIGSTRGATFTAVLTVSVARCEFNSVCVLKAQVKPKTLQKHDLDTFRDSPWIKTEVTVV